MTLCLGADVGGTWVRVCAVHDRGDGEPQVVGLRRERWAEGDATPEALGEAIARLARQALDEADAPGPVPLGVGMAAQLSADGELVRNAPNLGWRDLPVAASLREVCAGVASRVTLVNDLDAILAGELAWGAARGGDPALAVYVGTGVGGAYAVNGQVVRGASGNAGEIGHVKLLGFDGACGCGERGCVEALAGGANLQARVQDEAQRGRAPKAAAAEPGREVAAVEALAAAGDPWALALWAEVAEGLGHVIAGACTLLNPSVLVLGGGVLEHAPSLRTALVERTEWLALAVSREAVTIRDGALGDRAGVLGAAAAARVSVPGGTSA